MAGRGEKKWCVVRGDGKKEKVRGVAFVSGFVLIMNSHRYTLTIQIDPLCISYLLYYFGTPR